MLEIFLKKNKKLFLDNKFFILQEGSVRVKYILENGDIISYENILKKNEIVGNFLLLSEVDFFKLPEVEIEIESLENTILKEIVISENDISENIIFQKIFIQLIKQYIIKFISHICPPIKIMLILLKINSDKNGFIDKKNINYENLNMSRTQYYTLLSILKKNQLVKETNKKIILDLKEINRRLDFGNIFEKWV
ncbi:MAG: hypothetical protein RR523_04815 [Cetobacterium sp.]|uniref:hypothetical protein n=1 Tax=Cetobacterium sp. TaxID=2071632 RepID=UPI002FCBBEE6